MKDVRWLRGSRGLAFLVLAMLALLVPVRAGAGSEHRGAWVDEIVVSEEGDAARAVNMLQADRLDVYAVGISDPVLHRKIQDSEELGSDISYGTAVELTFNPAGPAFGEGALNPFHVPEVREAMNWLIDREHIAQEIYGGLARPRYLPINTVFPDYARLVKTARQLEIRYGHDPDRAERVIAREMRELGARRVDGTWRYEDEPVRLKFLIRLDDRRREVGDYIANELEDIGFQVVRDYRTAAEAAPIWIGSDPSEGRWHLYTGGWVSTGISRDEATVFNTFFTPRGRPDPLWQSYTPSKRFDRLADRLARRDYETLAQRREMMAEALKLAMQNSARIWLVDQKSIWPRRSEVEVAADLAGGMAGSRLWPLTVRFEDRTGGRMRIATSSILTEPWNPVAGSNWIFDTMVIRATADSALMPDPFTGLAWPQRIRGATVHVRQGLPVRSTHDWVELEFESSISVPEDVWIDWDAESKEFVTAGQKHPKGITARTRTVVRYERDLFERMWHDGTTVSLADALAGLILTFERAKQASALYDEAAVSAFETFMRHFKGLRILQEDPLVVEVYSDHLHRDAEMIAFSRASYLFPAYRSGTAPWHMVALGIRAERAGDLAFSKSKSDRMDVEHMSFVSGPSLRILDGHLRKAREQGYVPFEDVLGEYVEQGEAERRYERLARWRKEKGHFWVGMGPFQLEAVHPTQGVIVLHRFEGFRDRSDKWLRFAEPPDPEVRVSASSSRITTGSEAAFDIRLRCGEAPCEREDITFVRYLVFDGRNKLALSGRAEPAGRGRWRVRLDGEQTAALRPGSNRIEVAVSSKRMAIPSFGSASFVTMPPLEGGE